MKMSGSTKEPQTKLCIVTGSRAEYGLTFPLLHRIEASEVLELQLLVTGTHLSPQHGMTCDEITQDGFSIDCKVEMLLASDSRVGVTKSMGLAMIGFADAFDALDPDIVLITGDRFEALAAAVSASVGGFLIAHVHGGEVTYGSMDDSFRHAITKLSHIHFTATDSYRRRVIQMGEQPSDVFNVGGLGLDNLLETRFLDTEELSESLDVTLEGDIFLVTFHPETRGDGDNVSAIQELITALERLSDSSTIIVTGTNADPANNVIYEAFHAFTERGTNRHLFSSLGRQRYLSLLKITRALIGNSSSGIIEAPSFNVPTINIGSRQDGRERADSVIDVIADSDKIFTAIESLNNSAFQERLRSSTNPYGNGGAARTIVKILESRGAELSKTTNFFDITNFSISG